jgi:ESX secretion system ATPase EccB
MSHDRTVNPAYPVSPPRAVTPTGGQVPCLRQTMDAAHGVQVQVALGTAQPPVDPAPALATTDRLLADRVVVQPGSGLLMRDQPTPGADDGTWYLLVDSGVRYPLGGADVAGVLGYVGVTPVPVPGSLLDLIPAGRQLDRTAARATVPVAAGSAGGQEVS